MKRHVGFEVMRIREVMKEVLKCRVAEARECQRLATFLVKASSAPISCVMILGWILRISSLKPQPWFEAACAVTPNFQVVENTMAATLQGPEKFTEEAARRVVRDV